MRRILDTPHYVGSRHGPACKSTGELGTASAALPIASATVVEATSPVVVLQAEGIGPSIVSMVLVTSTEALPDSIMALMIL